MELTRLTTELVNMQSDTDQALLIQWMEEVESRVIEATTRLIAGGNYVDENTGFVNTVGELDDPIVSRILLEDGCFQSEQQEECLAVMNHAMASGTRNAIVEQVRMARGIQLSMLSVANATDPAAIRNELRAKASSMFRLVLPHVTDSIQRCTNRFQAAAVAAVEDRIR